MIFTDQLGREVNLNEAPKKIVSLVPSQSELLWDLGLQNELIGITKFCVHPKIMFSKVTRIGGTKQLHIDQIKSLKPDLIIGNKEENDKEQIIELAKDFTVWMSDVNTIDEALIMITEIGKMTRKENEASVISKNILQNFSNLKLQGLRGKRAAYLMWNNPMMVAADGTFINSILEKIGFINVFKNRSRYPIIELEELSELNPDYILLSSEPYPFSKGHKKEIENVCLRSTVKLVDGEMFSWYGSRLQIAPHYFTKEFQD